MFPRVRDNTSGTVTPSARADITNGLQDVPHRSRASLSSAAQPLSINWRGQRFALQRQQMAVSSEQLSLVCQGTLEYWLPNIAAYYNPWELVKNIDTRALPLEIWRQQVQGGPDNVVFQLLPPARAFSSVRSSLLHQSMDHPRTGPVPLVPRDGEGM